MQPQLEQVQEKLGHLSPKRLLEVANFIDFLQQRDQDSQLREGYSQASEKAFSKVWDNNEDAAYDDL